MGGNSIRIALDNHGVSLSGDHVNGIVQPVQQLRLPVQGVWGLFKYLGPAHVISRPANPALILGRHG
jgi:hypothetical protein